MWVWDILVLGAPGPWNPLTSSFLQHLFIIPLTSSYLLLSLPPTFLLWYCLVMGGEVSCNIGEWDWRWTFDLYIDLKKLWGGWVEPWDLLLPSTFSSSNLLPPPSYSSQLLHPPPKPPPNSSYLLQKGLRWLISSYMKRFQCYSVQKSFMVVVVGGGIAIICSYKLQVQVSY